MNIDRKESGKLEVRDSRNGKGLFALKNFALGQKIFRLKGKLITCNQEDDLDEETRNNTYRYDENLYLSPGTTAGNYANHSCNPNSKIIKEGSSLFFVAIKPIIKDKEIFFDYSTITAPDDEWVMKCNCGSALCRKKISTYIKLPKKLKEKYIAEGMIPSYILAI